MPAHQHALTTQTYEANGNEFKKWHRGMGHASAARILAAVNEDIPKSPLTPCDTCLKGKMTKLPFKGHFHPTEKSLEVIHGDLVGPISPASNGSA
jgi:hypothetical protein